MKEDLDSHLKEFFAGEVEKRREPELRYCGSLRFRGAAAVLGRLSLTAAAVLLFWSVAVLRPEHPLDSLIDPARVEQAVGSALLRSNMVMQAPLAEK